MKNWFTLFLILLKPEVLALPTQYFQGNFMLMTRLNYVQWVVIHWCIWYGWLSPEVGQCNVADSISVRRWPMPWRSLLASFCFTIIEKCRVMISSKTKVHCQDVCQIQEMSLPQCKIPVLGEECYQIFWPSGAQRGGC